MCVGGGQFGERKRSRKRVLGEETGTSRDSMHCVWIYVHLYFNTDSNSKVNVHVLNQSHVCNC